jgi:hypothetical protein
MRDASPFIFSSTMICENIPTQRVKFVYYGRERELPTIVERNLENLLVQCSLRAASVSRALPWTKLRVVTNHSPRHAVQGRARLS